MTLDDLDKKGLINYRINQAKSLEKDIDSLIAIGSYSSAVNRIYYGMFYMLLALALHNGFETSKHQQLIDWFNRNYIHAGIFGKAYGEYLKKAYENRLQGDYDVFTVFTLDEVTIMKVEYLIFCKQIEDFLSNQV
ncbi:MAG: HEPN domain-containing protein [Bacteroidetes bacterium]|nr:HEPN domain-containing protein [Bacteroidota bacterium]